MAQVEGILRRKALRAQRLQAALERIVVQLQELGARKVILFGSLARGETDVHSDLDLLVLMPATRTSSVWSEIVYETVERGVAADLIVYNEEDFQQEITRSSLLRNALASGRVVYEKRGGERGPEVVNAG